MLGSGDCSVPIVSVNGVAINNAKGAPRARCLVHLLRGECGITILDQNCGQGSGNFMLTRPSAPVRTVNSRPCRVGRGFPSVCITISGSQQGNVRTLYGGRMTPNARMVLLSSTFRRHCIGPNVGVLLISCRHVVYSSGLLPTKHLHRPVRKGEHTGVIVMAGYPGSVGPVRCQIVQGELGLCPCRDLCFSALGCNDLSRLFHGRRLSLGRAMHRGGVVLLANVTSPRRVGVSLRGRNTGAAPVTFRSRRCFDIGSVSRVGGSFSQVPRPGLIIAARGSTAQLGGLGNLDRRMRGTLCTLPVRVRVLRGRRRSFGRGVANCMFGGSEGDVLTGGWGSRPAQRHRYPKREVKWVNSEGREHRLCPVRKGPPFSYVRDKEARQAASFQGVEQRERRNRKEAVPLL